MQFKDIDSQAVVANWLTTMADEGRVAHAQMLAGGPQALPLAVAYAQYLCCTDRQHHDSGELRADSCGHCHSCRQFAELSHPDLGFVFPATSMGQEVSPSSELQGQFRQYLLDSGQSGKLDDWYASLGMENKQGQIFAPDAAYIVDRLSLRSYEGGYKMMIIWQPELMNAVAANKLLKTLEEPVGQTLIMLVATDTSHMLPTILSRVQTINVPGGDEVVCRPEYGSMFVAWMRLLFKLNMKALSDQVDLMAGLGREQLKQFLLYVLDRLERCLMTNLAGSGHPLGTGDERFDQSFPTMVTRRNAEAMAEAINQTIYSVERNAHPKIALMDLSFKLSKNIKNR
ncbi:MAG: hypothetical protein K5650_04330 [Bacteroidales bacterium]|nr:hypothetical protein [Bacteroidales bacterium]